MGNPVVHFEVIGSDVDQLSKFYSELFGWHVQAMPELSYGVVDTHAGKGINGGLGVDPQAGLKYVTFYIAVGDTDVYLKKIEEAGGKTAMETMTVPNVVTLAQFFDPAGNRVGLVKDDPSGDPQPVSKGSNPEVGWFEVLGKDVDALAKFYTTVFGWKLDRNEMGEGMVYNQVDTQTPGTGTSGGIGSSFDGQSHCTVYAGVPDVTKALKRAEALGGAIVMPEMKVSDDTIIGQFTDPDGNLFGVYKAMS